MARSNGGVIPEEVQTLFHKHSRMQTFIAQYEDEYDLLDKVKDACADLVNHKEKAQHLSLYGPGQPSQIQLKLDLNEWTTAQNNALMKQDIIEVYLKDYRRQMASYEAEITKRGYAIRQGSLVPGTVVPQQRSPSQSLNSVNEEPSASSAAVQVAS